MASNREIPHSGSLTAEQKAALIDRAFDYRGDVTITLASGEQVVGYVFNRDKEAVEPFLEIFPKLRPGETADARKLLFRDVVSLEFSGVDTAAGKSWHAWLDKVAEAERNGTIAERYPDEISD